MMSGGDGSHDQSYVWLGIDLGTTSVKAVIIDENGKIVQSLSKQTNAQIENTIGNVCDEQCPSKILQTVVDVTVPILNQYSCHIKGIGITGQMHGVVIWGSKGQAEGDCQSTLLEEGLECSSLYTWQDQRCSPEFLKSLPDPSNLSHPLATGHGCATLYWLGKHGSVREKALLNKSTSCGTIMDLLAVCLCDLDLSVTSDQLATSLGYFDASSGAWDTCLTKDKHFPALLLPKVVPVGTKIGQTRASLPDWPQDIPVYVAMGDVQCAMFGLLRDSHDAAVNISTSIQLGFSVTQEKARFSSIPSLALFPYFQGQHLALCAGLNGGNSLGCLAQWVASWVRELCYTSEVSTSSILEKMQELSDTLEPLSESESVTFCPAVYGERHNTALRGHISGMNPSNMSSIGHLFQAASQGLLDHLHSMVPVDFLVSQGIRRLMVTGSVPAKNSTVCRRLEELYGGKLEVVMSHQENAAEGSAYGAAYVVMRDMLRLSL